MGALMLTSGVSSPASPTTVVSPGGSTGDHAGRAADNTAHQPGGRMTDNRHVRDTRGIISTGGARARRGAVAAGTTLDTLDK